MAVTLRPEEKDEGKNARESSLAGHPMLFHIPTLFFSILFFLSSGFVAGAFPDSLFLIIIFLIGIFLIVKSISDSYLLSILPTTFAISTVSLLFFVSGPVDRRVVSALSAGVFYIGLIGLYRLRQAPRDVTARGMLSILAMATLFFSFSAWYGIFLNFRRFNELALMISFGATSLIVSLTVFHFFFREARKTLFFSFFLSFFCAEMAWFSTFWPFGYLTVGVAMLLFLSVLWEIVSRFSMGTVSGGRALWGFSIAMILLVVVLSSSVWLPVV